MSKLIVLGAATILLMAIFLQYPVQMINHNNISAMQVIVDTAKEQAKQEGYFTPEIIKSMTDDIAIQFGVAVAEVYVEATTTPKYRLNGFDERELIHYKVGVPIEKIIAANRFWGVSDRDNETMYYLGGSVASEALAP